MGDAAQLMHWRLIVGRFKGVLMAMSTPLLPARIDPCQAVLTHIGYSQLKYVICIFDSR